MGARLRTARCWVMVACVLIGALTFVHVVRGSDRLQSRGRSQGKAQAKKPAPPPEPELPPKEALDRARAAPTQKERIELLERFLSTYRGDALESEVRDLLMREYALKGERELREGSTQLAIKDFKSVMRVAPPVITDRVFGQFIFPMPMAMNAFGYRAESVALMKSFEPRFANDVNRLVQIGFFYVQIEAPIEAVRILERAIKLDPQNHRAHNSLGTAYLINLRLDDAAAEFEKALELNPKDEFANLNLGNLARASGDYQRAGEYYRNQLQAKPDDAEAHGGLSIVLLAEGRDEEAELEIKRAVELAPEDYRFLTQLAYFYTTRKKTVIARGLVERAARIDPRYAWAHVTKADIDTIEGKYGDALTTMIGTQTLAAFPTLSFELMKALMSLDGYDQAIEVMNRGFTFTEDGEFATTLGGVMKARSPRLDLLLDRERQASLFLNAQPTTAAQYRLAEALGQVDHYLKAALAGRKALEAATARKSRAGQPKKSGGAEGRALDEELKEATRPRRARPTPPPVDAELSAGRDAGLPGMVELLRAITAFTTLDDGRQAFRMIWAARKLADNNLALEAAEQLARRAIGVAETATEPDGSMRDAPLLDREGRKAVFLGRAHDTLGWALFKRGDTRGAIEHLSIAAQTYTPSAERNAVVWRLAVATQEAGDEKRALDLYIAGYEADSPTAAVRRAQIEALYKKLNGSLAGLEERLKLP
ncbi:MAG TPA: tetratricopeptide repeat protein [Blastocatellia bacterium]|nr:tetratricopeptide repeat protein [Blastocatellia bacterium]